MKTTIIKTTILLLLISSSCSTFSQTVINYETWTGSNACNVFGSETFVPATINGTNGTISHLTAVGQPIYDATNKTINLNCKEESGTPNGTEYRITSNFKQGFSYKITINAAQIMGSPVGGNSKLRLDLNNGGIGTNNQCNGMGSVAPNSSTLKRYNQVGSNSFQNYVFDYVSLSGQYINLMVTAEPPPGGQTLITILIRKITIEEIPPTVSFTLSSTTQSINCGSTSPITFTINNTGSTPATSYTWNLGPTPNGWLLNGSPAPATYTTNTANTLTLTPDCGKALSNVSATVTTSTGSFTTNTATVATTQNFAINGSNTICANPETYSVGTLPCNTTVSWQVSPNSGVVSHAASGSDYILTRTGTGTITLTANITTACGATVPPINKTITVQNTPPNPTSATMFNYQQVTGEKFAEYEILPNVPGATYVVTPSVQNNTYYFVNGNIVEIVYPCINAPGTFTGTVKIQNGCGISAGSVTINRSFSVCDGGGGRERIGRSIRVSSNAGMSNATISVFENETGKPVDIKWIQVLNKEGVLLKEYKYDNGVKQALLSLGNLKPDVYIIRAFDGTAWSSTKISIN